MTVNINLSDMSNTRVLPVSLSNWQPVEPVSYAWQSKCMPQKIKNLWEYWHGNIPCTLTSCLKARQYQRSLEIERRVRLEQLQWENEALLRSFQSHFTVAEPEQKSSLTKIKEFFTS